MKRLILTLFVFHLFCLSWNSLLAQNAYDPIKDGQSPNPKEQVRVTVVPAPLSGQSGEQTGRNCRFLVLVRSDVIQKDVFPIFDEKILTNVQSHPARQTITPNRWFCFYVSGALTASHTRSVDVRMSWQSKEKSVSVPLNTFYDLSLLSWRSLYRGEKKMPTFATVPSDFFKSTDKWQRLALPRLWPELGVTWAKTEIKIDVPARSQGKNYILDFPAIDDDDVTYFNGKKIGSTIGWDRLRRYVIPSNLIRSGQKNELLIGVVNNNAGGGINSSMFWLGPEDEEPEFSAQYGQLFPEDVIQHESKRRVNRAKGNPLPLRSMQVRDGVLEYIDGGEVALWGTNYYPQSWQQYLSLKERKVSHYKAVEQDLEDIAPAALAAKGATGLDPRRMNIIRIHVFDTEISDSKGNLVQNIHLDILDYLTAECQKHGLYLWLTPMAWWGSPNSLEGAFSNQIPMPAMTLLPETRAVQKNYLRQFLTHKNPYTKRRTLDEPCLALFEILNETLYWSYKNIIDTQDPSPKEQHLIPWILKVRANWERSLPDPSWKSAPAWDFYCYENVRNYIDEIHDVFRSTGARQPISYHCGSWSTKTPVYWAMADSKCEAISTNFYSGLTQTPIGDKKSFLKETVGKGLPRQLDGKARLVYEFDASDTLFQIDLYPAIARYWRELGVQAACQFQYDSRFTVDRNIDWPTHYLNLIHVPERFASFMLAGQTFRSLDRGVQTESNAERLIFPPAAVSWKENAAYFAKGALFMQARKTDWRPFEFPRNPTRILGTGSTPYFQYDGNGFIDLKLDEKSATLSLGPNVKRHRTDLRGTAEKPLTTLSYEKKTFKLDLPGWENAVYKTKSGKSVETGSGLAPGEYIIEKK